MRILIDEDTQARELIRLLRDTRHDVLSASDLKLLSMPDLKVLQVAAEENRVVLTQNTDDYRELHRLNPEHAGILLIYPLERGIRPAWARVVSAIDKLEPHFQSGDLQSVNDWFYLVPSEMG